MAARDLVKDLVRKTTVQTLGLLESEYFQGDLEGIRDHYVEKYGEEEGKKRFQEGCKDFLLVPVRSMSGMYANMIVLYAYAFTNAITKEGGREVSEERVEEVREFTMESYDRLREIVLRWADEDGIEADFGD